MTLRRLPENLKVLFTGFLLVLAIGLLMAGAQILMTHGMADGKLGLSINDIKYSYYGNRSGSKLETMLKGPMKAMAPDEARFELIEWTHNGAPGAQWASRIEPLIHAHCAGCHNADSHLPDFTKLEVLQQAAAVDHGASVTLLTRDSHIHLFGIAFIFLLLGAIFAFAEFPMFWQKVLIATPFAFLIIDILSWWLTKFWPVFAWMTMLGGIGYGLAGAVMILTSLAQMWLPQHSRRSDRETVLYSPYNLITRTSKNRRS